MRSGDTRAGRSSIASWRRLGLLGLCVGYTAACGPSGGRGAGGGSTGGATFSDVVRFVAAWESFEPSDSTCAALRPYWEAPSEGLEAYRAKFGVSFQDLCTAVLRRPGAYARLDTLLPALDSLSPVLDEVYAGFDALHALANDPSVYLVVGTGISAGSTTGGRHPMILLGMERHGSVAGLPWTIAHELVHTQQDHPRLGSLTGGPRLLRGTLLRHAIVEGAADFIAELVTGRPVVNPFGEANEAMLREEFLRDAPGKEYGKWLYNGGRDRPEGWPADLGYWIGYRIVKAYYDGSADKAAALDRILTIDDFKAFLEDSGYAGS